ncbi:MAG: hypothetical protein J1F18_01600 [Lachnospiraceae bacterium]|nr:hypothetical protein [Lachnospiraceae bacterium]
MKKINKEYFWLAYLVAISVVGILLLTDRMPKFNLNKDDRTDKGSERQEVLETETEGIASEAVAPKESVSAERNETEEERSLKEEYNELVKQIEEKEKQLEECRTQLEAEEKTKFAILHKYGEQMQGIRAKYQPLINYNVKNFEAQYDVGGSREIQDTNQGFYAIGELSKYTPWGIWVNMFTSMALDNSNANYDVMVSANNAFGTGMQAIIVDTRAEVEQFNAKLDFYETLTAESGNADFSRYTDEKLRMIWENQYLMEYALNGEDVNIEPYANEVYKKLYIMGATTKILEDYYQTLLTDCDSKTSSINRLENQYLEIMEVVDTDKTGEIANMVSDSELEKYMTPLINAGMKASQGYAGLGASSQLVDSTFKYTIYGRTYWHYKESITMVNGDRVHIYYAGNKPVYVNGYYFYNGRILNGDDSVDAETLYNEAMWMASASHEKKEQCELHMMLLLNACGQYY